MRVLVVEDEPRLAAGLRNGLEAEGFAVDVALDGNDGLWMAREHPYDGIVLDILLPGINGYKICETLRREGVWTPILMLTAKGGEWDEVEGLDTGADDYLTKPFSFDELLARLRVIARRLGHQDRLVVGDLVVDRDRRVVTRADVAVDVTAREFDLLALLAERAGRVVSRLQILDEVWDGETDLRSNAIDVHVAKLRAKVDRPFGRDSIQTVRGVGFRLADGSGG
jgi:DNA-binding response OmpR family regulator